MIRYPFLRKGLAAVVLAGCCLFQTGCALLQIPLDIVNAALDIASRMPMPPPGVF